MGAGAAVPVLGSSGVLFAGCLLQRDVTVKREFKSFCKCNGSSSIKRVRQYLETGEYGWKELELMKVFLVKFV